MLLSAHYEELLDRIDQLEKIVSVLQRQASPTDQRVSLEQASAEVGALLLSFAALTRSNRAATLTQA